jgi:hypothetical protein
MASDAGRRHGTDSALDFSPDLSHRCLVTRARYAVTTCFLSPGGRRLLTACAMGRRHGPLIAVGGKWTSFGQCVARGPTRLSGTGG